MYRMESIDLNVFFTFQEKEKKYFAEMVTIHINKEWGNER